MRIKAAVLRKSGATPPYATSKPLTIESLELDPPGQEEVLIRIAAAGLCHSDLSVISGSRPRPLPMALGHEAAGVVIEVGPGVRDLAPGDHVVLVFMPSCGRCMPCGEGRPALCEPGAAANGRGELLSGTRRIHQDGDYLNHHLGCSAFADHAVVSRRSVIKIDKDLPLTVAALFGCAVLTGVGAAVNTAAIKAGQTVAVIGLGGVGCAALLGAAAAGAAQIIAVDLSDSKLEVARALGATATVNAGTQDAIQLVRTMTNGGADVVMEMAGSPRALDSAYRMTRRGGMTVTAGLPGPDSTVGINIVSFVSEERTLKGSYIGSSVPVRDIPRYISLYRGGRLPIDRLMSGRLKFHDINMGFDLLHQGTTVRQIIEF